eukprot:CAMPEP_0202946856 /NCGR_PEP_ID=MMETSP1395-20130829/10347_1 /ASSEMBLY_ACC=CAM_ASM_000871 /TAXON_ID=5961 /ORGANISM="Blepharisma japonicum, Strain Stock R1072" /LENGTH=331 /DNA_ID=CAMNT_0049647705 /DNA_START=57 /DNA_END=1052 /DNA_ORIENTATION=-
MLQAMLNAEVGDDVYGEDTTVNRLQKKCAEIFGMEAGLFVASGTMGNLVSLLTHCKRGESVILGDRSHINVYEQGGIAALGGIFPSSVPNQEDGTLRTSDILGKILKENIHFSRPKVIAIENTHNISGGKALNVDYIREIVRIKEENKLKLHIDGARIFNAYYALKETNSQLTPKDLTRGADSVNICFSKGLCCPIGSVIVGSESFIKEALRNRKIVGGGMRQVGYVAAAALEALDSVEEIVTSDHLKTKKLHKGLKEIGCDVDAPISNILLFTPPKPFLPNEFVALMKERHVLGSVAYTNKIRFIPNSGTSNEDIDELLDIIKQIIKAKA